MLISFTVENYRSIKDRQSLIMEATADSHLRHSHVAHTAQGNYLKAAAVYGANASGKSNLIHAMVEMRRILFQTPHDNLERRNKLNVTPFLLNKRMAKEPSVFEVEFLQEEVVYRYGFIIGDDQVLEEWLYRKANAPKARPALIFSREKEDIKINTRQEKGLSELRRWTRPDVLFIRVCAEWNTTIGETVIAWFRKFNFASGLSDLGYFDFTADMMAEKKMREQLLQFIRKADFNISKIREIAPPVDQMPLIEAGKEVTQIFTTHTIFTDDGVEDGEIEFDLTKEESQGTRKFFSLAGPILHTIEEGAVLVVDEFEARLHPLLTQAILRWFLGPQNKKNAQLIIATHDTGLMAPEFLRRDQIWFCEKDPRGATSLYSLDEFDKQDVRASTKFNRRYLQGIFGGVPHVALNEYSTVAP